MDIYKEVTDHIMAQLENGIIPWQKPWIASGNAISHVTGHSYSRLNQMLLGRPGEYVTFAPTKRTKCLSSDTSTSFTSTNVKG